MDASSRQSRAPSHAGSSDGSFQPTGVLLSAEGWRSDKDRQSCADCDGVFGLTRRRHHCRACGDLFCGRCSSKQSDLEDAQGKVVRSQRVCNNCWTELSEDRGSPLWNAVGRMRYFYGLKRLGLDQHVLQGMSLAELRRALTDAGVESDAIGDIATRIRAMDDSAKSPDESQSMSASVNSGGRLSRISRRLSPLRSPSPGDRGGVASVKNVALAAAKQDKTRAEVEILTKQIAEMKRERDALQRKCDHEERRARDRAQAKKEVAWIRKRQKARREAEETRRDDLKYAMSETRDELAQRKEEFGRGRHHAARCWGCEQVFTGGRREHHCRVCYNAVCNECSLSRNERGERRCNLCLALAVAHGGGVLEQAAQNGDFRNFWSGLLEAAAEVLDPDLPEDDTAAPTDSPLASDPGAAD
eukprot:TRINITY_DN18526_c0_g1_i1.p1 TRINITY_DN18526_c0_g1~~TRINITY_DN18526_c0_g1_i1.p1  ORF type:complete len:444 (+),score=121.50 TRINITY_DN18526_c0_g1_i1:88-1332(+)